jgi:tetratricopeptide (TPR) repeat protein
MDGRISLVMVLGLSAGLAGCATFTGSTVTQTPPPQPVVETEKEPDLPPRQPKASTCIAFADFDMQKAADDRLAPAEKERLHEEARKAYQQALHLAPNDLQALSAMAHFYVAIGEHQRALEVYAKAVKIHPRQAPLWNEMGMCYAQQKQWQPALECMWHAVEVDPENRPYIHAYGLCLARAGRYNESLGVLTKLEGEPTAHYDLARMLHHLQQDELCKEHLRLALQGQPDMLAARQLLATLEGASVMNNTVNPPAYQPQ